MVNPTLDLLKQHRADVYEFHCAVGADGRRDIGWAVCIVDDATGTLSVCSDWGNASNLWGADPKHLGHPTLTHFIATRAHPSYLAQKLTSPRSVEFSWDATIAEFKKEIAGKRRSGAVDRDTAREAWDALDDMEHHGDGDKAEILFLEHLPDEVKDLFDEPWDLMKQAPTREYIALDRWIIPALIKACRAEVARRG